MDNQVDPSQRSAYGYTPTFWICTLFVVLFSVLTLVHIAQSVWHKARWMIATAGFCGLLEVLGWAARLWSSQNPPNSDAFQMQIVCTIMAPTPLLAACFVIFGRIINELGSSYSRLAPMLYTIIFTSCDVISLVIQAIGGGTAAAGDAQDDFDKTRTGGNIMLGGISFQLAVITVYALFMIEYFIRWSKDKPVASQLSFRRTDTDSTHHEKVAASRKMNVMITALVFTSVCLFIRAVYRVIELSDGWTGRIIRTQVYFNVLDGAMIVLAMFTLNVAYPGSLLRPIDGDAKKREMTEVA